MPVTETVYCSRSVASASDARLNCSDIPREPHVRHDLDDRSARKRAGDRASAGRTACGCEGREGSVAYAISAVRYTFARVEVTSDQFCAAWDAVCGDWLPDSGYEPSDGLSFEIYHNDHREHPEGKHIVDIVIPGRPLV